MLIDGKNEVYMIDRDNSIFHVSNLEFPFRKDLRTHLTNTLLDGVRGILCNCCYNFRTLWFRFRTKFLLVNHEISGVVQMQVLAES